MASQLKDHYDILYTGFADRCAHEFIMDLNPWKKRIGPIAEAEGLKFGETDIAKRLMDYGFHAPTMSWPVGGTLMIEPTESESLQECQRLVDAFKSIHGELMDIVDGRTKLTDSPLHYAPHTMDVVTSDTWDRKYTREQAAFPTAEQRIPGKKYWPTVSRIDDVYGDKNVVFACPPMSVFERDVRAQD